MEIKNYRAHTSETPSSLIAFFTLKIPRWGNFCIRGMRLFQKNGARWVSFPQEKVEKEGKNEYYPYNYFEDKEVMEKFRAEAIKAIDKYCLENAQKPPQTQNQHQDDELPF